jgi:hypothetical protein
MGLTQKKIAKLAKGKRHFHRDGLYVELSATSDNGSWLLRYQRDGVEHWHGLGALRDFKLPEAVERARKARQLLKDGIDPIEATREQKAKEKLEAAKQITFEVAAQRYYDAYQAKWSAKHREAFQHTLQQYAYPVMGQLPVADIDTSNILAVIEPIWADKHVTANRIRSRMEKVLDWCIPRGFRQGDNPARWRGHLKEIAAVEAQEGRPPSVAAV